MAIAKLSTEASVDLVAKGLIYMLEPEIKAKVKAFRDSIVKEIDDALEEACKSAAQAVVARVAEFHNSQDFMPELHIHFGFKEINNEKTKQTKNPA